MEYLDPGPKISEIFGPFLNFLSPFKNRFFKWFFLEQGKTASAQVLFFSSAPNMHTSYSLTSITASINHHNHTPVLPPWLLNHIARYVIDSTTITVVHYNNS